MSRNVRKANQASSSELNASLLDKKHPDVSVEVLTTSELSPADRAALWAILKDNMYDLYVHSSFGWHPIEKQKELFHSLSRFILARDDMIDGVDGNSAESPPTPAPVVAFVMFRFEREEKQDVAYCYELQVNKDRRRAGLGKYLMEQLTAIGSRWRMRKIMLTVLKSNSSARRFYDAQGFELDPTSPGYPEDDDEEEGWRDEEGKNGDEEGKNGEDDYDYEILSKSLS